MTIEAIISQSVFGADKKPVQQITNLVLDGLSTQADTSNTDAGKLYGSFTYNEATYTLTLYSDLTKMDAVATATSSELGSATITDENSSGLSGTVNFASYTADDTSIDVICFLSQDSDLPMNNLEGLSDYDENLGFAEFQLRAFCRIKEIVMSRYRTELFDPNWIDANSINGGTGGYNLSRVLNWDSLREASAHCAFAWIAEKQGVEDNIFYMRSKDSKNIFKAHVENVALRFDVNNDRVDDGQRSLRTWKITRA